MEAPISTKAAILAALANDAAYGSAIMDRVWVLSGGIMTLHSGSVYPALVALEKEGLIRKRKDLDGSLPRSASRACFYEITKKGREVVEQHRHIAMAVFFTEAVPTGMQLAYATSQ